MLIVFPSNWSKLISGSVVQADTWEEGWSGVESRTGFNYYSTDDDLLIQTIDRYDIVVQGVPELTCQKFMFITRLFFELETWNLGLMQSIMGHLIIKNEFDHYHLLDIPNDCVKKFKDFRRFTAKNMAISHSRRRIPQNWPKTLIKGCCLG